ncbi:MAG: ATP-binding cassette domain-containing protein [Bacteroidetes bacterium]|nr:ABC transporter ATP-binding protein [Bacteroidales bacterium]MBU1008901.1 ATP-binding cassette domain-containing protein [Bacteroidota bacterium]
MENKETVIRLENVSKTFVFRDKKVASFFTQLGWVFTGKNIRRIEALKNINLEVKKGEFLGIVGENGSGKSTLIHLMTGFYKPEKGGKAEISGNFIRLSLGLGFNQELTARENIYLNGSVMGLTLREINEKFDEMIAFAELEEYVDTKIKFYSRGMKARLSFAVAIHANAEILLMDEFFGGVGDEKFKVKSDKVFKESVLKGRTIVHVSHNLSTIRHYATRVILMHKGELVGMGTPDEVFEMYKNKIRVDKLNLRDYVDDDQSF